MRSNPDLESDYPTHAALILAGGESSRMGKDKTRLKIQGKTLLNRMIAVLNPIVSTTVVMLNCQQEIPEGVDQKKGHVIFGRDSIPKRGPLGAIADGVALLPEEIEYVYVLATDLPYVTTEWLLTLNHKMTSGIEVVHAIDKNITNPLIALYRRPVLQKAKELLVNGQKRPFFLWEGRETASVTAPESIPYLLEDMNQPQDYETAKHRLTVKNG